MNWLFWALGAALFAGLTAVLAKAGVKDIHPNLATAIRTSVALLFTWVLALATVSPLKLESISSRNWWFLAASGTATGLSWICYFNALQKGNVKQVAPIDKLSVVIAVVLALCFLGEKVSEKEWMGISLMVAGSLVLAWK